MENMSPMMRQYIEIKKANEDKIVFFRLGDFYEMFLDDAILASKELDLVLTARDAGNGKKAPMCGVPYHSADVYVERLVKKGYKIAICEQVEDPKTVKGIVKREIVKIITPGTVTENAMLPEGENNFIFSVFQGDDKFGISVCDISTGEAYVDLLLVNETEKLKELFYLYSPKEVVFNEAFLSQHEMGKFIKERIACSAEILLQEIYEDEQYDNLLLDKFGSVKLDELNVAPSSAEHFSLCGLLYYLEYTQKGSADRMTSLKRHAREGYMNIDPSTRRNLELTQTIRSGERKGSLLWVVDKTKTAIGKRLIKLYLDQPLTNPVQIDNRLNAVDELVKNTMKRLDISECLAQVTDIERLMTKVVLKTALPRELLSLKNALVQFPKLKELTLNSYSKNLKDIHNDIDNCEEVTKLIDDSIAENPPSQIKDGYYIAKGYNKELDELRALLENTKGILSEIEETERESTGIKTLKIGYNRVFGYYLEATKMYSNMVPAHYVRKQTLSNCERYITDDLKKLEEKILTANDKIAGIEAEIYRDTIEEITKYLSVISISAAAIARLDVYVSFADVAIENNYCRPEIIQTGRIDIFEGRHPVVEKLLRGDNAFVSNDTRIDSKNNRMSIITGPNMAGKSTYIRQVAVITLMAHIGCFVPATRAEISITDGIYTRVGASDDLAAGLSTFMVEMTEVSNILKSASSQSLLILDEVGRGTSTFDGMSIARAVIEYISSKIKAKTLFATHYHELTELENELDGVQNYNTAVKKQGEDIIFLRKIVPGGIDQSYGIEVSKLAGIPDWVVKRAKAILKDLEEKGYSEPKKKKKVPEEMQLSLNTKEKDAIEQLKAIDLDRLTPFEVTMKLYQIKALLKD